MKVGVDLGRLGELLITQEETMASLYDTYRRCLPELADFWRQLVVEERAHAQVLQQLRSLFDRGEILIRPARTDVAVIRRNIASMLDLAARAEGQGVHPVAALKAAMEFEQSSLEAHSFDVFDATTGAMRTELQELREHTEGHARRLAKALAIAEADLRKREAEGRQ